MSEITVERVGPWGGQLRRQLDDFRWTTIAGAPGSGKSSLCRAIALALAPLDAANALLHRHRHTQIVYKGCDGAYVYVALDNWAVQIFLAHENRTHRVTARNFDPAKPSPPVLGYACASMAPGSTIGDYMTNGCDTLFDARANVTPHDLLMLHLWGQQHRGENDRYSDVHARLCRVAPDASEHEYIAPFVSDPAYIGRRALALLTIAADIEARGCATQRCVVVLDDFDCVGGDVAARRLLAAYPLARFIASALPGARMPGQRVDL